MKPVGSCSSNSSVWVCLVSVWRGLMKQVVMQWEELWGGSALRRAAEEIFCVPRGQVRSGGYSDAHWVEKCMYIVQQNHFPSVRKASAAEEQLWCWRSPSLPQRVMADANPTVTIEQHRTRNGSWSPEVTHFPKTVTLQAKTAVLKCPLHAKSGVCDKLHICLPPEAQSKRVWKQQKLASWWPCGGCWQACESTGLINVTFGYGRHSWYCWSHVASPVVSEA